MQSLQKRQQWGCGWVAIHVLSAQHATKKAGRSTTKEYQKGTIAIPKRMFFAQRSYAGTDVTLQL
jgi:hypothetical protein